ncbi:MAG: hypothetical protein GYA24_07650 [Candidatus Lokiarchaeota archaeon]|nr:hypothetical protein [Candidatus Lokiarchaeota archaeon]
MGKMPKSQDDLRSFFEQDGGTFSESALYHFVFNDSVGELHMISLWPSQDDVTGSLIQLDLPKTELQAQLYLGKGTPTKRLRKIFEPWNPKFLFKPEAGYCLHPKYNV